MADLTGPASPSDAALREPRSAGAPEGGSRGPSDPEPVGLDTNVRDPEADALVRFAHVTPEEVARARRVQARMETVKPLGDILVELGVITKANLERATRRRRAQMSVIELLVEAEDISPEDLKAYHEAKGRPGSRSDRAILLEGGLVGEEQYLKALGGKLDIPFVEPQIGEVDTNLLQKVPMAYLMKHQVLPVRREDSGLVAIVAFPEDDGLIAELERSFGMPVTRQCSTRRRIIEALKTLERLRGKPLDGVKIQYREINKAPTAKEESGREAVQIVDYLLSRAMQMGASDLHIEPTLNKIRVRVRIDGTLQHLTDLPIDFAARLTARVKILAGMDVTERRLHQDGKIHVRIDGKEIDIRVSSYVSSFGETIVMRLLDRDRGIIPVDEIGFQPRVYSTLTDVVLRASSGLVLLVGPTGSGKTTSLYSFVDYSNHPSEKVITAEEPVEYTIAGIVQCSVNSKTGPSFPDSLRAIVRQDPDTIVVGEIRDQVTAGLAVEAALTGHKVYSTFHTEDAVGAFVRLLEMGAEPFLVGSTISAVIAQRLLRRLCTSCKRRRRPSTVDVRFLGLDAHALQGIDFFGPGECDECEGTGYRGRLAIHEVLVPNDDFRDAVLRQAPSAELRTLARTLPEFLTMQEDGLLKAVAGLTSLREIIENAPRDTGARPLAALKDVARAGRGS